MENPEGVLNLLDEFAKLKSKEIPNDLEEYLLYVAASGDPVYQWSLIKSLYRQKLINVITEFYEMCPVLDIPRCPNVDPFNYETMKNSLLKRLDSFSSAPFTIQRISELLTTPRKQYNRVDKFMRAIEKNIWVVSTREPGPREPTNTQDTSSNLVNGVTPRVCVTVKHPKRVKSIEERIKSGHPQLIDDDDEEEEEEEEEIDEYEQMEEESSAEILPNNETDDTSLQCTSVKDLIEKYENGTIFSNAEEKTEFEEKSVQLEEVSTENSDVPIAETEGEGESTTPTSNVALSEEADQAENSVQESSPNNVFYTEPMQKETIPPIVAADSSSDLPIQENKVEAREEGDSREEETLDSTSDVSAEETHPLAESSSSSASSSSNLETMESDAAETMMDTQVEPSTSDLSDGEFQPAPEPSSDMMSDMQAKEPDTVNETAESECI